MIKSRPIINFRRQSRRSWNEEKTTAENGIKSVKITDALKNVETIYNGGDYDKATEELSKIDTSKSYEMHKVKNISHCRRI